MASTYLLGLVIVTEYEGEPRREDSALGPESYLSPSYGRFG